MGYREMIKQVQQKSGFSDAEAKDALEATVECLAVHLTEGERKDFASQLPQQLKDIALSVYATEENASQDLFQQFIQNQQVEPEQAKRQLLAAWETIKEAISPGEIDDIRAQLPNRTVALLH